MGGCHVVLGAVLRVELYGVVRKDHDLDICRHEVRAFSGLKDLEFGDVQGLSGLGAWALNPKP